MLAHWAACPAWIAAGLSGWRQVLEHDPDPVAVRLPDAAEHRGEPRVVGALEVAEDDQLDGGGQRAERRVLRGALHGDARRVEGQLGVRRDSRSAPPGSSSAPARAPSPVRARRGGPVPSARSWRPGPPCPRRRRASGPPIPASRRRAAVSPVRAAPPASGPCTSASRAISSSATSASVKRQRVSWISRARAMKPPGSCRRHSRSTSATVMIRSPTVAATAPAAAARAGPFEPAVPVAGVRPRAACPGRSARPA